MAKSDSTSSVSTSNQAIDKRIAVETGMGISSDSSTINVQTVDGELMKATLDVLGKSDAVNGQGFTQLLSLADKLFTGAGQVIGKSQDTAMAQLQQIATAQNDAKGTIDQKTMIALAIAGAAMVIVPKMKGGK
ncbi:hypothetical protein [Nitrosovibrio sp. Nv4]|uniref:hypothetical protein n=1 Tax=Nitrosovibrio sp. Nv4 TaxID=1945880 RepID=UPI000BD3C2B3|nr:hypothetical protein [Nitrosovibrio sp. Nv4]SOD41606.1 hypothetical protein SAMN06298226_1908 [Nitrosovibrio sp. Nv4]